MTRHAVVLVNFEKISHLLLQITGPTMCGKADLSTKPNRDRFSYLTVWAEMLFLSFRNASLLKRATSAF